MRYLHFFKCIKRINFKCNDHCTYNALTWFCINLPTLLHAFHAFRTTLLINTFWNIVYWGGPFGCFARNINELGLILTPAAWINTPGHWPCLPADIHSWAACLKVRSWKTQYDGYTMRESTSPLSSGACPVLPCPTRQLFSRPLTLVIVWRLRVWHWQAAATWPVTVAGKDAPSGL